MLQNNNKILFMRKSSCTIWKCVPASDEKESGCWDGLGGIPGRVSTHGPTETPQGLWIQFKRELTLCRCSSRTKLILPMSFKMNLMLFPERGPSSTVMNPFDMTVVRMTSLVGLIVMYPDSRWRSSLSLDHAAALKRLLIGPPLIWSALTCSSKIWYCCPPEWKSQLLRCTWKWESLGMWLFQCALPSTVRPEEPKISVVDADVSCQTLLRTGDNCRNSFDSSSLYTLSFGMHHGQKQPRKSTHRHCRSTVEL